MNVLSLPTTITSHRPFLAPVLFSTVTSYLPESSLTDLSIPKQSVFGVVLIFVRSPSLTVISSLNQETLGAGLPEYRPVIANASPTLTISLSLKSSSIAGGAGNKRKINAYYLKDPKQF